MQVSAYRNQLSNEQIARDLVTQHLRKATELHRRQHKQLCSSKQQLTKLEALVKELKLKASKSQSEADHRGGMLRV
jgi:hypothetical protein